MKKILKHLEVLGSMDIERIHNATLSLLVDVGVRMKSDFGRKLLLDHGCRELAQDYISIPSDLIEKCIQKNRYFTVHGRVDHKSTAFGNGEVFTHNFGAVSTLIDFDTDTLRLTNTKDAIEAFRLMDKLDCLHLAGPLVSVTEVDVRLTQIVSAAIAIQNSTKPIYFTMVNGTEAKGAIDLLAAAAGGREKISKRYPAIMYASAISPLFFNDDCISVIREAAAVNLPLASLPCPTMGLTAPMSMAGALVLQNAETLAFNVIAKLLNEEEQVVYGARLGFANMKNAKRTSGYPEEGLMGAAVAQLARKYHMVSDVYGLGARTFDPYDIQQGYEKAICGFQPILAGADMTSGMGHMGSGAASCFETLVIDNEICSMMLKSCLGIHTGEQEELALDVIKEVVEEGETFITHEHTVDFLHRGELWKSGISVDLEFDPWVKKNKPSVADHAKAWIKETLQKEDDIPAIPSVDEALEKIVRDMGISMEGIRTKE